ncbi:MAG: hypothetical protein Kow0059_15890 [Candidatus Sumerlaeia bacterium]
MNCSLCGHEFALEDADRACQKCWLARYCSLVRCPRCGFEMPPEDRPSRFGRRRRPDGDLISLCVVSGKDESEMAKFDASESQRSLFRRLASRLALSTPSPGEALPAHPPAGPTRSDACRCPGHPLSAGADGVVPLFCVEPGRPVTIARLDTTQREGLRRLVAMGLLPQTRITLLRRYPTPVVQLGHSQFAIDRELAELVFVSLQ